MMLALALGGAGGAGGLDIGSGPLSPERFPHGRPKRSRRYPGVEDVPCPRCKAAVGVRCDQRTLGRHFQHAARVAAFEVAAEDIRPAEGSLNETD